MPDVPAERPTLAQNDRDMGAMAKLDGLDLRDEPRQAGDEHLFFLCAGIPCAAPLKSLREVLLSTPRPVFLPFSPRWMLGVCPLRMELVGLVDPVPMLLGDVGDGTPFWPANAASPAFPTAVSTPTGSGPLPALVVGSDECSLGWVVQAVGDIAPIAEHDIATAPDVIDAARLPFVSRYVVGIYAPPDGDQRHVVLNMKTLLTDLVDAMREKESVRG